MNTKPKELYLSPECETMELNLEGVIAISDPKFNDPFGGQNDL